MIVEPPDIPGGPRREWEFAEKGWYLENRQGSSGAARALLWPTASCVTSEAPAAPPWERTGPPLRRWTFSVSERGLAAMRAYLGLQRGPPLPGFPGWHAGRRDYHLFHNCHHFTATALRAAGLPIRPWWAITGPLIRAQLNHASRHQRLASPR